MTKKQTYIVLIIAVVIALLGITFGASLQTVSAIYDINSDGIVSFEDASLAWYNRESTSTLYDVNSDGRITFEDAALIWYNIGTSETTAETNWLSDLIWG